MAKVPKRTDLCHYVGRVSPRFHFCLALTRSGEAGCDWRARGAYDAGMSARLTAASQQAWARTRILLNLGRVQDATAEAVRASAVTDWARFGPSTNWGAGAIHSSDEMAVGWCWLEPGSYRLLIARSVMAEFALTNALAEFADVIESMDEPGFRSFDPVNWRALTDLGF